MNTPKTIALWPDGCPHNVTGEPTPGAPGKAESFTVADLVPGTCYFAMCSFDAESNRSEMSNVIKVEVK